MTNKPSKEFMNLKPKIVNILKKNNVKKAGIFGSYARGEEKKRSDIDILIDFKGSLMDLVGIEMEIADALKKKVDILTYKGISPYLKQKILNEEVRII